MKKPSTKRSGLLLITLAVLLALVAIIAPTLAYYITSTKGVKSEHTPAKPSDPSFAKPSDPSFALGEDGGTEVNNVYIWVPDYGYPVYVRASIIITWQKPRKNSTDELIVHYEQPQKNTHYTLLTGSGTDGSWKTAGEDTREPDDGFYYYTKPVESSGKIDPKNPVYKQIKIPLIEQCALTANCQPPEGDWIFNVEIIVQTVQAIGFTDPDAQGNETPAWRDAWNGAYNYETIKY